MPKITGAGSASNADALPAVPAPEQAPEPVVEEVKEKRIAQPLPAPHKAAAPQKKTTKAAVKAVDE